MKVKTFFIAVGTAFIAMVSTACGYTKESQAMDIRDIEEKYNVVAFENMTAEEIDSIFSQYCREIDSLCYSRGFEIDADSIDIMNPNEMEEEAYRLLGPYFYVWRSKESKYSWEFDVVTARYCH